MILAGIKIPPNYGPVYTRIFEKTYQDLKAQNNIGLIPFLLEGVAIRSELMQADGIHPNEQAQELILNNVWPVISEKI